MTTVYIVRHAEAEGNKNKTFQGRTDCNVTEKGYRQLDALAEKFKDIKIDKLYSSPLIRTVETAKAVNKYHNLPINIDENVIEIDGGVFEGQKWDEVPKMYPEAHNLWVNEPHNFKVEASESMKDVYNRMKKAITSIASKNKDKTVAVVSHGCSIRNFLCYANKMPLDQIITLGWADNTSISKIEFDDELEPKVIFQNDASHLSKDPTLQTQAWWKE